MARFEQAIALRPDLAEALQQPGQRAQRPGQARPKRRPNTSARWLSSPIFLEAHNNLGIVLWEQGKTRPGRGTVSSEQSLSSPISPRRTTTWATRSKQQGKFDEAAASYDQALALKPDYAEAHYDRADLKTFRAGDADLAALEALAADPAVCPPARCCTSTSRSARRSKTSATIARAFEHLLQGNALKRREVDYDEAAYQRTFRLIAELFDSSLLDRFAGAGDPSPSPIFVLGMPRSGSTLVEQILASHPQVHAAGELKNLDRVVRAVSDAAGRPVPFPQLASGTRRRRLAATGPGLSGQPADSCRTARRGSPTRRRATFSMSA